MLYGWKENSILTNCLAACTHLSSTVSSYSNRKCKKSPFSRTAAHIFVSPGDAPAIITQYVARMERQFNAYQTFRSTYLSIFNSFRVIRCLNQCVSPKIAIFTTFWFPLGTLNVVWMEREFHAYKLSRCMFSSNYNRFWDRARYLWKSRHFIIPPCIRRHR